MYQFIYVKINSFLCENNLKLKIEENIYNVFFLLFPLFNLL